jgi:hypothetical protein
MLNPMTRRGAHVLAALGLTAVLTAFAACRHRPTTGGRCRVENQLVCIGDDRAVACNSGTWVELPCRGVHGCGRRGESDDCDDTIALDGDACPRNPPIDYACTADRGEALLCKEGRFGLWRACRGPDKCEVVDGRNLRCDTRAGEPGDPCGQRGTYSCTPDHSAMLLCDGTALAFASSCRGPKGCATAPGEGQVECDDSVAIEGDPCDRPKRIACSVDRKSELVCARSKYEKRRDCRRSECRLDGNELFCD